MIDRQRGFLLHMAAEGMAAVVGGCAGAVVAGPAGAALGGVVGKMAEEAIRYFGPGIAGQWARWFAGASPADQNAALRELAALPPDEARVIAEQAIARAAPNAAESDRRLAVEYLAGVPGAVRRSLVTGRQGALEVPITLRLVQPETLMSLLPVNPPPYPVGAELPGTPYRLVELLGVGGFGAVYKASTPTLQHLHFAIKFCLSPATLDALKRERLNLDRLQAAQAGADVPGRDRIVRLCGYDLEHRTPYLVYEFVQGKDLAVNIAELRTRTGRGYTPEAALPIVTAVTEALAFAHGAGLVHRDLKPANVLADGKSAKLIDFGIGGASASVALTHSRIGTTTVDRLAAADQASLLRGAGTPLYMSPEQKRGEAADPRQDLYSLGVLWYQMLLGDVTRELHPGWMDDLHECDVPQSHLDVIQRCVGGLKKRPENAGTLLPLVRALGTQPTVAVAEPKPTAPPPTVDARTAQTLRDDVVNLLGEFLEMPALLIGGIVLLAVGAIPLLLSLIFGCVYLAEPRPGMGGFAWASVVLLLVGIAFEGIGITLLRSYRDRRKRRQDEIIRQARAITDRYGDAPVLSSATFDPAECWALVRYLEERYLQRTVPVTITFPGRFMLFDQPLKVMLDGYMLGEGSYRNGVNLSVRLCKGPHMVGLRAPGAGREQWAMFNLTGDLASRVELASTTSGIKAEVVTAY